MVSPIAHNRWYQDSFEPSSCGNSMPFPRWHKAIRRRISPAPTRVLSIGHGDKCQWGIAIYDILVDSYMFKPSGPCLNLWLRRRHGMVAHRSGIGACHAKQIYGQTQWHQPGVSATASHKEEYAHGKCHHKPCGMRCRIDNFLGERVGVLLLHATLCLGLRLGSIVAFFLATAV